VAEPWIIAVSFSSRLVSATMTHEATKQATIRFAGRFASGDSGGLARVAESVPPSAELRNSLGVSERLVAEEETTNLEQEQLG
jgi:hypothetical protein